MPVVLISKAVLLGLVVFLIGAAMACSDPLKRIACCLCGLCSLKFYRSLFEAGKPKDPVKIKTQSPLVDAVRNRHTTRDGNRTVKQHPNPSAPVARFFRYVGTSMLFERIADGGTVQLPTNTSRSAATMLRRPSRLSRPLVTRASVTSISFLCVRSLPSGAARG